MGLDQLTALLFQQAAQKDQLNQRGVENTGAGLQGILRALQQNQALTSQENQAQLGRDASATQARLGRESRERIAGTTREKSPLEAANLEAAFRARIESLRASGRGAAADALMKRAGLGPRLRVRASQYPPESGR